MRYFLEPVGETFSNGQIWAAFARFFNAMLKALDQVKTEAGPLLLSGRVGDRIQLRWAGILRGDFDKRILQYSMAMPDSIEDVPQLLERRVAEMDFLIETRSWKHAVETVRSDTKEGAKEDKPDKEGGEEDEPDKEGAVPAAQLPADWNQMADQQRLKLAETLTLQAYRDWSHRMRLREVEAAQRVLELRVRICDSIEECALEMNQSGEVARLTIADALQACKRPIVKQASKQPRLDIASTKELATSIKQASPRDEPAPGRGPGPLEGLRAAVGGLGGGVPR
jgi:hypothetical protein